MYADIFIENNYKKIDTLYTYIVPDTLEVEVGCRVQISFGRGIRIGMVLRLYPDYEGEYREGLKTVLDVLDQSPILNEEAIELALWMKDRYMVGYSKAFSPLLPPGNLKKIQRKLVLEKDLTQEEKEFLMPFTEGVFEQFSPEDQRKLAMWVKRGKCHFQYLSLTKVKAKTQKVFVLSQEKKQDWKNLSEKQRLVLEYLDKVGEASQKEIMMELQLSSSPIDTLLKKEWIHSYEREIYREPYEKRKMTSRKILNEEQQRALQSILSTSREVTLLHGLTGSGKTEIYLQLAEEIVHRGGEVIVLVPEIGLTPQMIDRFQSRFGNIVSILHSKLSKGERYDQYRKVKNKEVKIVVGVRSAVFAPFENCQLIIIDEEHDSSYEFHDSLKYDTKEVAMRRMQGKGRVLLGSATPSIESFYQAEQGKYHLVTLKKRAVEGAALPKMEIVDLRQELMGGNVSIFSRLLQRSICETLEKKEQIILFLNRRGYANFVSCRSCGHVIECDHCDISMTYHRSKNRMVCHYCGATKPVPTICPNCGSKYIKEFGIGTEQVEEEIHKLFPMARTLRMDRDTTVAKDAYDKMYAAVKRQEVDIVIGTQMVSKGFDFENVTLVGIVAADLSLYVSDYRACERTFQLITQVSGRAGRSNKEGQVILQTYDPENYVIQYAAEGSYEKFYDQELKERKIYQYPPFVKLIHFTISSTSEEEAFRWARGFLYHIGRNVEGLSIEATNLITLPKIKNIYRRKFTLKVLPQEAELLMERLKRVIIFSRIHEQRNIFLDVEF